MAKKYSKLANNSNFIAYIRLHKVHKGVDVVVQEISHHVQHTQPWFES